MATAAGRPRRFDTNQILDRALELFWRKGFASTTTRELETELSLNQSSLYNSFGSKAQFFDAVLDRYETITAKALIEPLEQSHEGIGSIQEFFTSLAKWVTQGKHRGCLLINLMAEDGGANNVISARTACYRDRVKQALQIALKRAEDKGEVSQNLSESRALILFGLALGFNIAARGGSIQSELDALLSAIQNQIRSWEI